jgi:hypothetical protein
LPDEVIKSGSQVVNNITYNDRQEWRDWRTRLDPINLIAGLRVSLGSDGIEVRLGKVIDPCVKVADVRFGPFDFRMDAD